MILCIVILKMSFRIVSILLLEVLVYFRKYIGGYMLKLGILSSVKSCIQHDLLELGFTEHRFIWVRLREGAGG